MEAPDLRPAFRQDAADTVLGLYDALMDGLPAEVRGERMAAAFTAHLDAAEDAFTRGAVAQDRQQMINGWNQLTEVTGQVNSALVELAVFLLASTVNAADMPASEVMRQAVQRADEG